MRLLTYLVVLESINAPQTNTRSPDLEGVTVDDSRSAADSAGIGDGKRSSTAHEDYTGEERCCAINSHGSNSLDWRVQASV